MQYCNNEIHSKQKNVFSGADMESISWRNKKEIPDRALTMAETTTGTMSQNRAITESVTNKR